MSGEVRRWRRKSLGLVGMNRCQGGVGMRRVWPKGWLGPTVRMVWGTFRQQMSCEGGEVLGSRRFVLLARERIWTGRRFAIHQIVFDWGWCWGGMAWFVRDWGDIVGGRWCWCWGDIGWFVGNWGDGQLLTGVVDVFMTLFVVGHLQTNQSEKCFFLQSNNFIPHPQVCTQFHTLKESDS